MDPQKILIVEDHPSIRAMVESIFQARGYLVDTASNGEEGLNYARTGGFATIILDLKMPHIDGLSFLKMYRQTPPKAPNGPVIIFSSAEYHYAREEAMRLGAKAFFIKDDLQATHFADQVEAIIKSNPTPNTPTPQTT
jgi:CheY-like chemotaxis protein